MNRRPHPLQCSSSLECTDYIRERMIDDVPVIKIMWDGEELIERLLEFKSMEDKQ